MAKSSNEPWPANLMRVVRAVADAATSDKNAEAPDSGTGYRDAIEHLRFCFAAEEENSRRHAKATGVLTTVAVAILASGLFPLGLDAKGAAFITEPEWIGIVIRIVLALALGCLIWSLTYLVGKLPGRGGRLERVQEKRQIFSASVLLMPDPEVVQALSESDHETVKPVLQQSFLSTLTAAEELGIRNNRRDAELFVARQWILRGLVLTTFGLMLYVSFYQRAHPVETEGVEQEWSMLRSSRHES